MKLLAALSLVLAVLLAVSPVRAQTAASGRFAATESCPAVTSIRGGTNPGHVTVSPGMSYRIEGGNTAEPTFYWILVPDAKPDHRWVPVTCGTSTLAEAATSAPSTGAAPSTGKTQYVFAASWEPAFCESLPDKPECKAEPASSFEATHFSLHGLWPQPRSRAYCGVSASDKALDDNSADWGRLPPVNLSAATRAALDTAMPGTKSHLERHEWTTHGTCYGAEEEEYFSDALAVLAALNGSPVRDLFASHVGQSLTLAEIRAAFDRAFGPGAGQRLRLACRRDGDRTLIEELTVGLTGDIAEPKAVGGLIVAAAPTGGGCPSGLVDAIGPQ